jgi:hypothetical protein
VHLIDPDPSEKRGEIDITAANRTITASNPGQAACVPGPGVAPIGPFTLSERGYRAFDSALRTVPTSVAQSQQSDSTKSGQSMPVKSGNGLGLAGRLGLGLASVGGLIVAISISDNNSSDRPVKP